MKKANIYNLGNYSGSDKRGWMFGLFDKKWMKNERVKNIHIGSIEPKQVRGNHYHTKQKEWMFVFGGKAIFAWQEGNKILRRKISSKEFLLFEIPAGVSHAIKNIDTHKIYVCAFANNVYNKQNPDMVEDKIL